MTFGGLHQRVRAGELFRYPANTCQPSRWSRTTSASPIPVAAPVTKADFIGKRYPTGGEFVRGRYLCPTLGIIRNCSQVEQDGVRCRAPAIGSRSVGQCE